MIKPVLVHPVRFPASGADWISTTTFAKFMYAHYFSFLVSSFVTLRPQCGQYRSRLRYSLKYFARLVLLRNTFSVCCATFSCCATVCPILCAYFFARSSRATRSTTLLSSKESEVSIIPHVLCNCVALQSSFFSR